MDLGTERRAWMLVYVCLGVIDGGTAARFTVDLLEAFANIKEAEVKL